VGPALDEYIREVRRGARVGRERPVRAGEVEVEIDPVRARWHRLHASHAARRLPAGRYAAAAAGGVQDSAPRAALVGLHARVEDVPPDAWEHPDLAQIWFRWADFVVPRADVGVFTLGTLTRHRPWADALEALADAVVADVGGPGGRAPSRDVQRRLPWAPLRLSSTTGRVRIRWDARTVDVIAAGRPADDPAEARRELARRFVHAHGPVGPRHLARWAGLPAADARETWDELGDELVPVAFAGHRRWMLRPDVAAADRLARPTGIRLLPQGDAVLHVNDAALPPAPTLAPRPEAGVTSRLVNSLTGRVVVDGDMVGAWGRVKGAVTVVPWGAPPAARRAEEIEQEAGSLARTVGYPLTFRWLDPA
jgi:hypothetical protein